MFDTPEEKAALAAAIAEAVEGLQGKNNDLIAEVRQLKRGKDIDPADVTKLEDSIDLLKTELGETKKALKESEKTGKKSAEDLGSEQGFTKKLLIDNGLTAELTANGVTNPAHLSGATALLREGVQVVVEGNTRVAKVGEKSLAEHVKEWAGSDTGKNYVAADKNGGGGGRGGDEHTAESLGKLSPAQKMDAGRGKQKAA